MYLYFHDIQHDPVLIDRDLPYGTVSVASRGHASISSCFPSVVSSAGIACAGVSGSVFTCIAERTREEAMKL